MRTNIRSHIVMLLVGMILTPSIAFGGQAGRGTISHRLVSPGPEPAAKPQADAQIHREITPAPEQERRGFIGLGIGPSVPFGSFADTSSDNPRAGHAQLGYTDTFVNLGYRFRDRLGIAVAFSYSEYMMRDGGDDDWWQVPVLAVGPMYSLPLGTKSSLDLKAMVGMMALTPVVDSYGTEDRTGAGLAIDVRATVRYDVFRRWALFAEGGLQSSNVSFSSGRRTDVRQIISGLGIAFRPTW